MVENGLKSNMVIIMVNVNIYMYIVPEVKVARSGLVVPFIENPTKRSSNKFH